MTELYYHEPLHEKKHIRELIIHSAGESGEWLWCEMTFDDGTKLQSYYFKGVYG